MRAVLSVKGICNWSLEKSFYLSILLFTLLLSLGLCYFQFLRLYNAKEEQLQQEMHFVKNETEKASASYKAMLDFISKNIVDKKLIDNQHAISGLLKNVYISDHEAHGKISFSDISWYSANSNLAINRYGTMQAPKHFSADLESNFRTFPKVMHLYAIENEAKIPSVKELYFAMGITNSKGEYIGKLVILLDIEPWVSSLRERLDKTADVVAIINNQQDVLLSTDESLRNAAINVPLKLSGSQVNITYSRYIFLYYAEFAQSPYVVMYGYNKQALVQKLIKANAPVILALWISTLLFLSAFFIFSKKLKANIRHEFIKDTKKSASERSKLIEENANIMAKLSKECEFFSASSKYTKSLLEVYRISDREKEKLTASINNDIANSLTEIKEFIRVLVRAQEGVIDVPITCDKQVKILTNIHNKLVYMSEFAVVYQEEDVDVAAVICGIVGIYAKDIFLNNFSINSKISSKIKTIRFNTLLFQQVIVSLLRISVECSRSGGEIKIEAVKKKLKAKESLVISIKDNGFQLTEDYESTLEVNKAISHLKLDFNTIKSLIEMHNGTLEMQYTKEGKTIYLTLPFKASSDNDKKATVEGGNVVLFKNN